jgi:NADPH:quinone reductase-like Zn-dependent oxidoreductase
MRRLGAEEVIDARREPDRLRELAPDGIDAALVLAGGNNLESILDAVRPGGRVAFPSGVEPEPRRRPRVRRLEYDAEVGPRQFAQLDRAVSEARLRVPIAAVFSLRQAARAHTRAEAGHVLGRVVLQVRKGAISRGR